MLAAGRLVVFPTETVYGLGARVDNDDAVRGIFEAKGRPADNPLIVHVATVGMAKRYGMLGPLEKALFDRFSPGPLTLVVPRRKGAVSDLVTAGGDTVAIRIPDSDLALELIRRVNCGIAAPSANRSSRPSPTTAEYALREMGRRVAAVLDGGRCDVGIESTVAIIHGSTAQVLRPGVITAKQLNDFLVTADGLEELSESPRNGVYDGDSGALIRSPGTSFRHYSPRIPVRAIGRDSETLESLKHELVSRAASRGSDEWKPTMAGAHRVLFVRVQRETENSENAADGERLLGDLYMAVEKQVRDQGGTVYLMSSFQELERHFYSLLVDWEKSVEEIWVEIPPEDGGHSGLRDRVLRAAGKLT